MWTKAIPIFECAYPQCKALFIFDQSSAHTSLGLDALNAFDMNRSNGGKQRFQRDTFIPNDKTVPDASKCGAKQTMKTDDGQAKGLDAVLTEHRFKTHG